MSLDITNEHLVMASLIKNDEYFKKVLPFIKKEYFLDNTDKTIITIIKNFASKYAKAPDFTVLKNVISSSRKPETEINDVLFTIDHISNITPPESTEYLIETTERFCKEKAIYCAIAKSYEIYDGTNKEFKIEAIPEILKEAICVCFDSSVGHDYDEDAEKRWEYYTSPINKIPFDIELLNAITNGGIPRKTFNLIAAGVNVGKTLMLIILTAMYRKLGYDVLYITNEVSDMELGQRLDASILGVDTDAIIHLGKTKYLNKLASLRGPGTGKLIVKEYPTGTCDSNKIRALLQDLKLKKNFIPTVVINDYITINVSSQLTQNTNMGEYYTKVAEEQRAIAVEFNHILWSAAQLTTPAMESTDPSISELANSQGLARTADMIWAVCRSESLDTMGQIAFKQLKTRYHKMKIVRWVLGIDIGKHRLIEVTGQDIDGITNTYRPRPHPSHVKEEDVVPKEATVIPDEPIQLSSNKNKFKKSLIFAEEQSAHDEASEYM